MNCAFKVLWLEDEPDWYRALCENVKEHLSEKYGLLLETQRYSGDDFNIEDFKKNSFDLIFVDYTLAEGIRGNEIIENIRNCQILTDILFYSSGYEEMLESIKSANLPLNGVYNADRKEVPAISKLLIDKIVRRSEDVTNLRGFVLDSCCDFEDKTVQIMEALWEKMDLDGRSFLSNAAKKLVEERIHSFKKCCTKLDKDGIFLKNLNDNFCITSGDRLKLLEKSMPILEKNFRFEPKEKHTTISVSYAEELNLYRNRLGHDVVLDKIKIKGECVEVNGKLFKEMRNRIAEYNNLFSEIESILNL